MKFLRLALHLCLWLLVMSACLPSVGLCLTPQVTEETGLTIHEVTFLAEGSLEDGVLLELRDLISIRPGDKLTRRELSRSVILLFATGRFADVSAKAIQHPQGLALEFTLTPRQFISTDNISFEGNKRLTQDKLIRALKLTSNRIDYSPEIGTRLSQRIQEVYSRIGYNSARVTPHVRQHDAKKNDELIFTVEEGQPSQLKSIAFSGAPAFTTNELTQVLKLKLGDVLDQNILKAGMDRLKAHYREHGYFAARFGQPELKLTKGVESDATLVIPVSAGVPVDVAFAGNDSFSDQELLQMLAYDGTDRLTESLASDLAQRLKQRLWLSGYPHAQVQFSWNQMTESERSTLLFTISEGDWFRVESVTHEGLTALDPDDMANNLQQAMEAAVQSIPQKVLPNGAHLVGGPDSGEKSSRPLIHPKEIYGEAIYRQHAAQIQARLQGEGYLSAKISAPQLETTPGDPHVGRVVFKIAQGTQTRVTEVDVSQPPEGMTEKALKQALQLEKGGVFSSQRLTTSKENLGNLMRTAGYLYSSVKTTVEFAEGKKGAHVYFELIEGPRVHLGKIVIRGHEKTSENVVRAALAFKEGDVLTQNGIQQSQRTLVKLGIFRSVRIDMESPDLAEPTKDLTILLNERNTWLLSTGLGYSLMDGPRLMAEVTKINLFGQALQLQLQGKLNFLELSPIESIRTAQSGGDAIGRRFNVGLTYPHVLWLSPLDVTLRTNVLHEYLLRSSYTFQQTAGILGADFEVNRHLSFSLQYEIEEVILNRLNSDADKSTLWIDRERLRFEEGRVLLHGVRPLFKVDFRDNAIVPRKGFLLMGQVELVKSITAPDDEIEPFFFLKVQGQANAYLPLPASSVLALSLSAGRVFPLDKDKSSRTIVPKRFFQGGAVSQRGFMDDGLIPEDIRRALHSQRENCELSGDCQFSDNYASEGGELFVLARAEIRIPLGNSQFELALFFDAGNLWLDRDLFELFTLRYTSGVGLRMLTPIGPASLDIGINLDPDKALGEPRVVPHFSIGMF